MSNGESSTSKEAAAAAAAAAHHLPTETPSNSQVVQDDDDDYVNECKTALGLLMQIISHSDLETASKIQKKVVEAFIQADTSDPAPANDTTTPQQKKDSKGKGVSRQNNGGDEMEWEAA